MNESNPPVRVLLDGLTSLERSDDRRVFLDFTCRGEPALRERLERMLGVQSEALAFFDIETAPPAVETPAAGDFAQDATEGVGTRIGRYLLIERLGEGGYGVVYLAEQQEPVKRRVALKIIRLGMDTENVIARFEMERQALAMMDHPNIARVLDVGATSTGRPYFVMQLVDGEKITGYCDAKLLGIPQRLKLFIRICQAIQHAHQKGVIHRDIKPSNILVWERDGEPVPEVIDFGIAKATAAGFDEDATFTVEGQFIGTPAYMSPEQACGNGMDVDTRSDVYSLGSLLYELLSGRPPFDPTELRNAGVDEIRRMLREMEPAVPSAAVEGLGTDELRETAARRNCEPQKLAGQIKGDLDRIVMKAMAKDLELRYPTADAFAADVTCFLNHEPVSARTPSRMYRFRKLVRRNKVAFAACTAVVISLLFGLGGSTWMFFRANRAREAAELARANETALRRKAEFAQSITRAAVLLKYGNIEQADASLAGIPPASAQPSLESADTFRTLGLWHAKEGRWRLAGARFAALAYSITSVDMTDTDAISRDLLPAVASVCEGGDMAEYEDLRAMAVERFGTTSNPVVAEQVIKACLLLPASPKVIAHLAPLETLILAAHSIPAKQTAYDRHLGAWREFSVALMEFRKGNLDRSLESISKCTESTNEDPARDAMAWTLRAMISHLQGRAEDAHVDWVAARASVDENFVRNPGIFEKSDSQWQDWVNAHILMREADALIGN